MIRVIIHGHGSLLMGESGAQNRQECPSFHFQPLEEKRFQLLQNQIAVGFPRITQDHFVFFFFFNNIDFSFSFFFPQQQQMLDFLMDENILIRRLKADVQ